MSRDGIEDAAIEHDTPVDGIAFLLFECGWVSKCERQHGDHERQQHAVSEHDPNAHRIPRRTSACIRSSQ